MSSIDLILSAWHLNIRYNAQSLFIWKCDKIGFRKCNQNILMSSVELTCMHVCTCAYILKKVCISIYNTYKHTYTFVQQLIYIILIFMHVFTHSYSLICTYMWIKITHINKDFSKNMSIKWEKIGNEKE